MSSGGGKPTVQTYDPSVKDAELSMMKGELTDRVTKNAYSLQKNANVYSEMALGELNKGLGLLSNYLNTQVENERATGRVSDRALQDGIGLHEKAKAGANFLTSSTLEYLKQADMMDRSS